MCQIFPCGTGGEEALGNLQKDLIVLHYSSLMHFHRDGCVLYGFLICANNLEVFKLFVFSELKDQE